MLPQILCRQSYVPSYFFSNDLQLWQYGGLEELVNALLEEDGDLHVSFIFSHRPIPLL